MLTAPHDQIHALEHRLLVPGGRDVVEHDDVLCRRASRGTRLRAGTRRGPGQGPRQNPADGALIGHASHTHVEEGAHVVERLQEHVGGQDDRQCIADADRSARQAHEGHPRGHGDEEQGEQAVGEQDDELVSRQQAHDGAPVRLPLQAQAGADALGRPG